MKFLTVSLAELLPGLLITLCKMLWLHWRWVFLGHAECMKLRWNNNLLQDVAHQRGGLCSGRTRVHSLRSIFQVHTSRAAAGNFALAHVLPGPLNHGAQGE